MTPAANDRGGSHCCKPAERWVFLCALLASDLRLLVVSLLCPSPVTTESGRRSLSRACTNRCSHRDLDGGSFFQLLVEQCFGPSGNVARHRQREDNKAVRMSKNIEPPSTNRFLAMSLGFVIGMMLIAAFQISPMLMIVLITGGIAVYIEYQARA